MVSKEYAMGTLNLTAEEFKKLEKWHKKIVRRRKSRYFGAIGGEVTFKITPTSLGEIIEAECCGQEITLRDL